MTRPRLPMTDDERLERRRLQYRNAKRRKQGLPEEAAPLHTMPSLYGARPVAVLVGSTWVPALIDRDGRRVWFDR